LKNHRYNLKLENNSLLLKTTPANGMLAPVKYEKRFHGAKMG
jgi:hypothetical protein